ncbi:hypothetical protein RRG08_056242 [Elysia crispata]|uniref:MADF domain-containing protein n=1 Tax=Elysia crispata TaxID=231223 RepID=A0AAE1E5I9_9GAST|nr:hypothetical protein RRG08_056242 [Elysia crispata]
MVRGILFEYVPYDFPSHVSRLTREETRSGKVCLLTFLTIRELRRMDDYKKNVIEMVREHIFLWNPVHRDYKNKEQRKQAWEDIDMKIREEDHKRGRGTIVWGAYPDETFETESEKDTDR